THALPTLDWALAEMIVNQHGGELRMGAGTPTPPGRRSPPAHHPRSDGKMENRLLHVDEDPFIRKQLQEPFSAQRYAVATAGNATEALRLLGERDFALAVVDIKLPGTDGIGLTREIRDRWQDLDVVMITGYASIKGAVEAIKQGASDYITKPF